MCLLAGKLKIQQEVYYTTSFSKEEQKIVKELNLHRVNDVLALFGVKRVNNVLNFASKRCPEPYQLSSQK